MLNNSNFSIKLYLKIWEDDIKYRWYKILSKCPTKNNKSTCDISGKCCSTALLQSQPDFQNQKGWLQDEIEAAGHNVNFYPKFHYELNFIEQFWCAAKHYTREHCSYTIDCLQNKYSIGLQINFLCYN